MKIIETESDFKSAVTAKKAVIFITFEWSGQAKMSEQVITAWGEAWQTRHQDLGISLFKTDPDNNLFMKEWVQEKVNERRGYGSLVWIKNAEIVAYEPNAAAVSSDAIESRTEAIFRS